MRNPGGYLLITSPDAVVERDTFTCCHCGRVVIVRPGSGKERGWCLFCGKPTCGRKECSSGCVPFEHRLEAWENSQRLRKMI